MKPSGSRKSTRTIEVRIAFAIPDHLKDLVKDVTLSFHSQEIADDSRAVQVPWTDAVRLVGSENVFSVRLRVPAALPCLLHVLTLIDEAGDAEQEGLIVRRHLGFANLTVPNGSDEVSISVSEFESYSLVMPTAPRLRAAA